MSNNRIEAISVILYLSGPNRIIPLEPAEVSVLLEIAFKKLDISPEEMAEGAKHMIKVEDGKISHSSWINTDNPRKSTH